MTREIFYEKCTIECTVQQFTALMHTKQRDFDGLWPATLQSSLEICSVSGERFDDPALHAGWVLYSIPSIEIDSALNVNLSYASATVELYDLPMQRVTVYFTDGQEPGEYRTSCIGSPFVHFVDLLKTEVGLLTPSKGPGRLPGLPVLANPSDMLIVRWLMDDPALPIPLIAKRLQLSPGTVRARRKALRLMGYRL